MGTMKAVLFDMDGLLVDSERIGIRAAIATGEKMGYPVTEALATQMLGVTKEQSHAMYHSAFPQMDMDLFHRLFAEQMEGAVERGEVHAMRGAKELLEYLKQAGIPRIVASSTDLAHVQKRLEKAELAQLFDDFVTGDMVTHSKPDPEIFLIAAKRAGADIHDCLVLEDSVNGIKAGRASGARVIMVPDVIPYAEALAPYCDAVMESLQDVKAWLERALRICPPSDNPVITATLPSK